MKLFLQNLCATALFLPLMAFGDTIGDYCGMNDPMNRPWLKKIAPDKLKLMQDAGVKWVRTDMHWSSVERLRGKYNFQNNDQIKSLLKDADVKFLPILGYNHPDKTIYPAWKNLEPWCNFVREVVKHHEKEMPYWEVWNEPDIPHFWGNPVNMSAKANAAEYTILLKETYKVIKSINPDLKVLYGGTSGLPEAFIEKSYQEGAGDYFDIMVIHPYRFMGLPESAVIDRVKTLTALMNKYNIKKPIWFTELGWSAGGVSCFLDFLAAAMNKAGIDPQKATIAILCHPNGEFDSAADAITANFRAAERINLEELNQIDLSRYTVVVPTGYESFPTKYIPRLVKYVADGGTLFLPAGLPFYYDLTEDRQRGFTRHQVVDKFMSAFHISWDTWWRNKAIPKKMTFIRPAAEFAKQIKQDPIWRPQGQILTTKNLKGNDQFIPILEAGNDQFTGPVGGLYKLDSDLKGNIIISVCSVRPDIWIQETQAKFLPRGYLTSLGCGVEKIFWYNFRSDERRISDREGFFGVLDKNLNPKPAYRALKTLTELCPPGSSRPVLKNDGLLYTASWTRPDGVKVWAYWTTLGAKKLEIQIKGTLQKAVNHLGEKANQAAGMATEAVCYLVGPDDVQFQNVNLKTVQIP